MHDGKWEKSARAAREVRGKKLGIVGYGNIGSQLSALVEALGLEVYFFRCSVFACPRRALACANTEQRTPVGGYISNLG